MVKNVVAKNFKGRDIDIEIGPKTLIIGPNGTGKSAIVQSLELALNGSVSGGAHKTNQGILDAFGGGNEKMTVEVCVDGNGLTRVGRQFSRDSRGQVSQTYLVDRRRSLSQSFAAAVASAPKAVVVEDVLGLSPLKLISYLATFTGGADMDHLESQIASASTRLNQTRAKLKENDGYISRIMAGIAGLNLPPGSYAEIQAEIKKTESDLAQAKRDLKAAEKEEAERMEEVKKRFEEEQKKIFEEKIAALEKLEQAAAKANMPIQDDIPNSLEDEIGGLPPTQRTLYPVGQEHLGPPEQTKYYPKLDAIESIQRIIKTITDAPCPTCGNRVVLMVCKSELSKWQTEKRRTR